MEKIKITLGEDRIDKLRRKMNYGEFYNRVNFIVDYMVQNIVRQSAVPLGSAAIESFRHNLKKYMLNTTYGLSTDPLESSLLNRYGSMSKNIERISPPYQIMNRRYHKSWLWLNQIIRSIENTNSPAYIKCTGNCLKPSTSLDINAVIWSNEYVKPENTDEYFPDFEAVSSFYPKIDLSTLKLDTIRIFPWLPSIPVNLTKNPFDAMYRPEKSRQFIDTLYLKK